MLKRIAAALLILLLCGVTAMGKVLEGEDIYDSSKWTNRVNSSNSPNFITVEPDKIRLGVTGGGNQLLYYNSTDAADYKDYTIEADVCHLESRYGATNNFAVSGIGARCTVGTSYNGYNFLFNEPVMYNGVKNGTGTFRIVKTVNCEIANNNGAVALGNNANAKAVSGEYTWAADAVLHFIISFSGNNITFKVLDREDPNDVQTVADLSFTDTENTTFDKGTFMAFAFRSWFEVSNLTVKMERRPTIEIEADEDSVGISDRAGYTYVDINTVLSDSETGDNIKWSTPSAPSFVSIEEEESLCETDGVESLSNRLIIDNSGLSDDTDITVTIKAEIEGTQASAAKDVHITALTVADSLIITGPDTITIPLNYSSSYLYILEAYSNSVKMTDFTADWSIKESISGVSVNGQTGELIVKSDTQEGTATIKVSVDEVTKEFPVKMVKEKIKTTPVGGSGGGGSSGSSDKTFRAEDLKNLPPVIPIPPAEEKLTDYKGHWCEQMIRDLLSKGVISGDFESGDVRPDALVTKEEAIKILINVLNIDTSGEKNYVGDGNTSEWALSYIAAAIDAGIVTGDEDGKVNGKNNLTRAELTAMVARALNLSDGDIALLDNFSDNGEIPQWCRGYMAALISNNIIVGFEDKTLRPDAAVTRAEVFAIAYRIGV